MHRLSHLLYRGYNKHFLLLEVSFEFCVYAGEKVWTTYLALDEEEEASIFIEYNTGEYKAIRRANNLSFDDIPFGWYSSLFDIIQDNSSQ